MYHPPIYLGIESLKPSSNFPRPLVLFSLIISERLASQALASSHMHEPTKGEWSGVAYSCLLYFVSVSILCEGEGNKDMCAVVIKMNRYVFQFITLLYLVFPRSNSSL